MRSLTRTLLVTASTAALLAPTLPAQAATVLDTEIHQVATGKKARFQLLLKDEGVVVLTFAARKDGRWKILDKEVVGGTYTDTSTDADIRDVNHDYEGAPKTGGQGLVTWYGPTEEEGYAEYFGFDLKTGELDLYGG